MTIESPRQKRGGTNQKTEARRRKPPERQFCYSTELPKQKRGGASRPKDNFTIPPFGSAACASSSIILLHYHLIRPLARLGFCSGSAACAARLLLVLLRGSASVNVIELPKKKRGGANQKNRSAAAQAARKKILLFHHLIRPLQPRRDRVSTGARLGFCSDSARQYRRTRNDNNNVFNRALQALNH